MSTDTRRPLQPHEQRILNVVKRINDMTRQPASTVSIVVEFGLVIEERHMRRYLRTLERAGYLERLTVHSGWQVKP